MNNFEERLLHLINECSQENGCNTPDFILARYMASCLSAFNIAVKSRDDWYGVELCPGCSKFPETMKMGDL